MDPALSLQGRCGNIAGNTQANQLLGGGATYTTGSAPSPCLVFADGDAFTNCCSSINLQFNGTSLSLNRTNRFWRDYQRTQLSSEDSARIYKCAGGGYDQFDKVPVAVLPTLTIQRPRFSQTEDATVRSQDWHAGTARTRGSPNGPRPCTPRASTTKSTLPTT